MNYEAERERFARYLEGTRWTIHYAIRATVMEAICLEFMHCKWILELGAGYSSYCLRQLDAMVVSIDHDPEYAELVSRYLIINNCRQPQVDTTRNWKDTLRTWHLAQHTKGYDGILVDHGPDMQDRLRDMKSVIKCLAPGGIIVLDDYKGAYKQELYSRMPGFVIQTHRDGTRHWGVAKRAT